MSTFLCLAVALAISAWCAVRSHRLLVAALWLALVSILIAWLFYMLGAPLLAVIELSVGAGLVMVLLVFTLSLAGDEAMERAALTPPVLAVLLVAAAAGLAVWTAGPPLPEPPPSAEVAAAGRVWQLWEQRPLDVLLQVVLILAGALGVVGLLQPDPAVAAAPAARPAASSSAVAAAEAPAAAAAEVLP